MLPIIIFIIVTITILKYTYLYNIDSFTNYANTKFIDWYSEANPQKNINIRYKNTYYYEYDNDQYLQRLNDIFKPTHSEKIPNNLNKLNLINDKTELDFITDKYKSYIDQIRIGVQQPELKLLNTSEPVQVVSDTLVAWFLNKLLIEVILYRNNKFEGKKVLFYYNSYKNELLDIKIIEQVSEDQIALYPVLPSNPFETNYDKANIVSSRDLNAIPLSQQTSVLSQKTIDSDAKKPVLQKLILSKSSLFRTLNI